MENSNFGFIENSSDDNLLQLVSFNIGNEEYAVDILNVHEINRIVDITRVPNAPDYIVGVINLRGKVIPIINLRRRLGIIDANSTNDNRIIVVEFESKVIGFIVDNVHEVVRVSKSLFEPPPPVVSGINSDFITGLCKLENRLLILLDLEKILKPIDDINK